VTILPAWNMIYR